MGSMATAILTGLILAVLGTNGFVWWWFQSRTVPKVEQIKLGQAELTTLAQERRAENEYLAAQLREYRAALDQCRNDLILIQERKP